MRTLKFNVKGQSIRKDPDCSFSDLVVGSVGYLECKFAFDDAWAGFRKVAEFYSSVRGEPESVLIQSGRCDVPESASRARAFYICVVGGKGKQRIRTDKVKIVQQS